MRTQNKENWYYVFWIIAMVAFIIPQVFTAIAYRKLGSILNHPIQVEIVETSRLRVGL